MDPHASTDPGQVVVRLLAAADDFDIDACERLLAGAIADLEPLVLVRDVVAPVLREAGSRWHRGEMSVVQEHMLSGVVRRQMSYALDRYLASADGPTILFTTLSGERHELGGLMGAVLAASQGFRCIYLGPDLPPAEIGRFCARRRVDALALSLVTQPHVIDVPAQLHELRNCVAPDIEIWVAGRAAAVLAREPLPAGVEMINDLAGFLESLARLRTRTE